MNAALIARLCLLASTTATAPACTGAGYQAAQRSLAEVAVAPSPKSTPKPEPAPALASEEAPPHMHYQCPMDPEIRQSTPGRCPICEMRLVLVKDEPGEGSGAHASH